MKISFCNLFLFQIFLIFLLFFSCSFTEITISSEKIPITIQSDQNGYVCGAGTYQVSEGDSMVISVCQVAEHYKFKEWVFTSGDSNCILWDKFDDTTVIKNITGPVSLKAIFAMHEFNLVITQSSTGGSISATPAPIVPAQGTHSYPYGTIVNLAASPDTGYQFGSWTGTTGGSSTTITMDGSKTVSASFTSIPNSGGIIYVWKGVPTAGTGTSWANAYRELYAALDAAPANATIWVATGVYAPHDNATPLSPKAGVKIYGGFNGFEKQLADRKFNEHFTELDGTGALALMNVQNAGFYISGCVIRNAVNYGLYIVKSNAIIEDCIFRNNTGSAIHFENLGTGSLTGEQIRRCVFHSNTASAGYGYGVAVNISNYVRGTVIVNSIFTDNTNGPAICDFNGSRTTANLTSIYNCTVVSNRSGSAEPGGYHCTGNSRIKGSIFYFNTNASSPVKGTQIDSTYMVDSCDIQNWASTGIAKRDISNFSSQKDIDPNFVSNTIPLSDALWYGNANNLNFIPRESSLLNDFMYDQKPYDDLRGRSRGSPTADKSDLGAYEQ